MHLTSKKAVSILLLLAALTGLLMTTVFAEGEGAEYASMFARSPASLLPPVLAIVLALITKEVYTSLFAGCLVGGLMYANFNPVLAITSTFDTLVANRGVPGNFRNHRSADEPLRWFQSLWRLG